MNREEHLQLMKQKMDKNLEIASKKNQDYCGKNEDSDPFSNFKLASILSNGRLTIEDSIFTRLADKVARIGTLLSQEAIVNDESIQDTLNDLSNYALILSNYLDSKKPKRGVPLPDTTVPKCEHFGMGSMVAYIGTDIRFLGFTGKVVAYVDSSDECCVKIDTKYFSIPKKDLCLM